MAPCRSLGLLLAIGCLTLPPARGAPRAQSTPGTADYTQALHDVANAQRQQAGLASLRRNDRLARAAQSQAEQAAAAGHLAHVLPGARYPRPEDRLAASGYRWRAFAENLAFGQPRPSDAVDAWMRSPGHRRNLMDPAYTELGTGYARDGAGRAYYVQVFGTPL